MKYLLEKLVEEGTNRSVGGNFFYVFLGLCMGLMCFIVTVLFVGYAVERYKKRFWRKIRPEEIIFFILGCCVILLVFVGACLIIASVGIVIRRTL